MITISVDLIYIAQGVTCGNMQNTVADSATSFVQTVSAITRSKKVDLKNLLSSCSRKQCAGVHCQLSSVTARQSLLYTYSTSSHTTSSFTVAFQ
jgi:hypothetical protein